MAEAFLALSGDLPGLRTLVVVKRILPHLSANDQFVRMFLDEARIGALLDHPNIPRIIEVGHDEDGYFLAMEAVPGKTLSAILRRAARRERPLGQADAAFIVGRAAAALGYAHALTDADGRPLNIVHRDVSPENILVSFEGAVKVIDFGIASAHGRMSETLVGGLKGKVEYMSPEQAAGAPVDRRSDVFSLGIVLWEALSGRRLFRRETDLAVMRAISDDPHPATVGPAPDRAPPRTHRDDRAGTGARRSVPGRARDGAAARAPRVQDRRLRSRPAGHADQATVPRRPCGLEGDGGHGAGGRGNLRAAEDHRRVPAARWREHPHGGADAGAAQEGCGARRRRAPRSRRRSRRSCRRRPGDSGEHPALPRLTGWGDAQQDPASEGGELSSGIGDDAAAYAALRAWAVKRTRLRGPVWLWLLVGAMSAAGVFAGLLWRARAPVTPPSIVDVGDPARAAEARPVVLPLRSVADSPSPAAAPAAPASAPAAAVADAPEPTAFAPIVPPAPTVAAPAPTAEPAPPTESPAAPPAAVRPALRRPPPVPVRVVKKPVRKPAIAHRAPAAAKPAPAAAKPAPAPQPTARPAPRPPGSPLVRPGWRDPFD